jgi:hypothetical protein
MQLHRLAQVNTKGGQSNRHMNFRGSHGRHLSRYARSASLKIRMFGISRDTALRRKNICIVALSQSLDVISDFICVFIPGMRRYDTYRLLTPGSLAPPTVGGRCGGALLFGLDSRIKRSVTLPDLPPLEPRRLSRGGSKTISFPMAGNRTVRCPFRTSGE